jgi:phosphoribosylformylglycinamidine cyclo-ligase
VLPQNSRALADLASWQLPAVFRWLQEQGNIVESEMLRTFNCGVGMVLVLPQEEASGAIELLGEHGESAWLLGRVESAVGEPEVQFAGASR